MTRMDKHDSWIEPTRTVRTIEHLLLFGAAVLLSGCGWMVQAAQTMHLRGYDKNISDATQAIANARDGAARAHAFSTRGSAYAEKARYSRAFKLVTADEYDRLFQLAVKDHDQAIALNPGSTEAYYNRGQAYWDRGSQDEFEHKDAKSWFDHAAADFQVSTERDPRNYMAFDMLGMSHQENGAWEQAIGDYTREQSLNSKLGTARLADAYCGRGQQDAKNKNLEAATADYEKSVELGSNTDGCSCEPYNSLLVIYTQTGQYDKAWKFVHWAQTSKHWLDAELVEYLKKNSGRNS